MSSASVPLRRLLQTKNGFTFVEMMISVAIIGILTLTLPAVLKISLAGTSAIEARNSLKSGAQNAINHIGANLVQSKRVFENSANDGPFLGRIQLGGAPSAIAGSTLPIINEYGSLSVNSTDFLQTNVGNLLFFASTDSPVDLTVTNSGSTNQTVRIDLYHFNYYYLAYSVTGTIGAQKEIDLWEWHSIKYADYNEIESIPDAVASSHTATALNGVGISYAWNPSATAVSSAFFTLSTNSITAASNHTIPAASSGNMIPMLTGTMSLGFRSSVSPNTGTAFPSSVPVPLFAAASGTFPSGFEIAVVGPNSARQVLIRLVTAAQGALNHYIANESLVVMSARDLW